MKTFSTDQPPPPVERSKAWSYLVTNLLVMPGLGSVMASHKTAGYLQMILALAGFVVTLIALVRIVLVWVQEFQLPNDPHLYYAAIAGIAIFLVAWIWSLGTSLTFFREKK